MPDFSMMRWTVDHADKHHRAEAAKERPCPDCGQGLALCSGRNSGKFFWSHIIDGDCPRGRIGGKMFFSTRQEAVDSPNPWREIPLPINGENTPLPAEDELP